MKLLDYQLVELIATENIKLLQVSTATTRYSLRMLW